MRGEARGDPGGARRLAVGGAGAAAWACLALALLAACATPRRPAAPLATVPLGYEETGEASWYGHPYHGRRTASGEIYDMHQMTAAHPTLPFGTWVLVTNTASGRSARVRITDRGPFVDGRVIDVSYAAARLLGAVGPGVIPVRLRVVAAPVSAAPRPAGRFAVQVGAFADEERAREVQAALGRSGISAAVVTAEVDDRRVYRVRVGPFASRDDAERQAAQVSRLGYRVLVVSD